MDREKDQFSLPKLDTGRTVNAILQTNFVNKSQIEYNIARTSWANACDDIANSTRRLYFLHIIPYDLPSPDSRCVKD